MRVEVEGEKYIHKLRGQINKILAGKVCHDINTDAPSQLYIHGEFMSVWSFMQSLKHSTKAKAAKQGKAEPPG